MEALSLNDHLPYLRNWHYSQTQERRRYSPRLPTPEPSQSCYSCESDSPRHASQRRDKDPLILYPPISAHKDSRLGGIDENRYERRDSRQYSPPQSPPLNGSDVLRPTLPPLKTVLGSSIPSPPRKSSLAESTGQPSPREPNYTHTTYKPPSLYPNKKPRIDTVVDANHSPSLPSTFSSPATPSVVVFEPNPTVDAARSNRSFTPAPGRIDAYATRRLSTQSHPTPYRTRTPTRTTPYPLPPAFGSGAEVDKSGSTRVQRKFDHSPLSLPKSDSTIPPRLPSLFQSELGRYVSPDYDDRPSQSTFRRSSTTSSGEWPALHLERDEQASVQVETRPEMHVSAGFATDSLNGQSELLSQSQASLAPSSYHVDRQAFFMPSHCDYQHGRARKRSNLPKQSTEIMKQWFDQNIANPYPSEEQKAFFSSATGISMTQVSNWFINHRRRCPELRDKRERNRCREGDI